MRIEMKYGVMFGFAVMLYVMIEHVLGFNTTRHDIGEYTRFGAVIIPVIGVFVGIKMKRNRDLKGVMTFGEGIKAGVIIAVVQTTLTTIFFLFYGSLINPDFLNSVIEFQRQKMVLAGAAEAEITSAMDQLRTMYSFPVQPLFQMVIGLLYGVVFSALFSLFLRKERLLEPV